MSKNQKQRAEKKELEVVTAEAVVVPSRRLMLL